MSESDHHRHRLEKLRQLLIETHVTPEDARKEARSGPREARAEELRRRPGWTCTCGKRCESAWLPASCPACGKVRTK